MYETTEIISTDYHNIIESVYPDYKNINKDLQQIILDKGDEMQHVTNVKADMTNYKMLRNPTFKIIVKFVEEIIYQRLMDERMTLEALKVLQVKHIDCWGMRYKSGDHCVAHAHWPATFSWIYYVAGCDNCAELIFDRTNYSVKPAPGKLVIWPGHLSHTVPQQTCTHDRIAISGNLQVIVKEKQ
tara:strand:+ start:4081 stop:4635 length:555 start_codon:yes stop_codon:yes gene_type:complete